jgi:hypothetical protein
MADPTPTELRQQFLLEFTRAVIETMASRAPTQEAPQQLREEELMPSVHPQEIVFPVVQVPVQNTFAIPSQAHVVPQTPKSSAPTPNQLKNILEDSSINAVECQGPNKPLVLRKQGATVLSSVTLSEAEIQKQINQWAENTNSPLTNGILRADNENLTITAVVSDLIGSRFMVIRKPSVHAL